MAKITQSMEYYYGKPEESIIRAAKDYYDAVKKDMNSRDCSWEHCYSEFSKARNERPCKDDRKDYLSLQLAFYLASWGMYRGSTFLLQKDYKIHKPVVEVIMEPKYDTLCGITWGNLTNKENLDFLFELTERIKKYYESVRKDVYVQAGKKEPVNSVSDTLITKVLLGTLACVPAYDELFVDGIKALNISSGSFNRRSVGKLMNFMAGREIMFNSAREELQKEEYRCLPMKYLDMAIWQIGWEKQQKKHRKIVS